MGLLLNRAARVGRWVLTHKKRTAAYVLGGGAAVYATVFACVACAVSPTDSRVRLADGREVAYCRWQTGADPVARVVLVHGAPADASSWTRLRNKTEASGPDRVEWVAVDRLGYGHSTPGTESRLAEQARAIEPWLDNAPSGGVILVGHSYGGPVVVRAAADFPGKVRGIVLVAGACDPYMNDAQWFRRAVDGVAALVPEPWEVGNRELLDLTDENRAMEAMLDRVTCPVVVLHGKWDPVCPYEGTVGYLQKRLTNAEQVRVVTLARAGHNLHLWHPDAILAGISTLLDAPLR